MIKKEYYRLDEVRERFGVTFDDVRYWVENHKIDLAFYVNNKKFVVGAWQKNNKGFIAFGIADYRGLVSISNGEQVELLQNGQASCRHFQLLNKNSITAFNLEYPFKSSIPNKLTVEWRPKTTEQIICDSIPAKICPVENKNALKELGKTVLSSLEAYGKRTNSDAVVDTGSYDKFSDYLFSFEDVEFTVTDICITFNDLVKVGAINETLSSVSPQNTHEALTPKVEEPKRSEKRESQLTNLIERILLAKPKLKTIEVWRILREELETDLIDRVYDTEGILKDMTPNELLWQGRYGRNTSVKRSSFDSKVSRIRKSLGINKK